jgi:hypothetical protein
MELTNMHLEAIRKAARTVEYGSITINIAASSKTLDLVVEKRVKIEKEPESPEVRRGKEGVGRIEKTI